MNSITPGHIKTFVTDFIQVRMSEQGRDDAFVASDDCDILLSGALDSLGFLELITSVQEHYEREIDFESLDPDSATVLGPLCDFIAEKLA